MVDRKTKQKQETLYGGKWYRKALKNALKEQFKGKPKYTKVKLGDKSYEVPNWRYFNLLSGAGSAFMKPYYSESTSIQPFNWMDPVGAALGVGGMLMGSNPFLNALGLGTDEPEMIPYTPMLPSGSPYGQPSHYGWDQPVMPQFFGSPWRY